MVFLCKEDELKVMKAFIEGASLHTHFIKLDLLCTHLKNMGDVISPESHAMQLC